MLRDTESFNRLRKETAEACIESGLDLEIHHLVIDDSAGTDPEVKQKVRAKGYDQAQFSDCSMIVVICARRNSKLTRSRIRRLPCE